MVVINCAIVFLVSLIPLFIAIPILHVFREWAYASAFAGFSKTHRKKIFKAQPLLRKLTLFYLLAYRNPHKTKRRIICYYSYILFALAVSVWVFLVGMNMLPSHYKKHNLFYYKEIIDCLVGSIYLYKNRMP